MTGRSPEPHARYSGYVGTGEKTSVPRADIHCNCGSSIVYKFRGYRQLLFYSNPFFFCFVILVFLFCFLFFFYCYYYYAPPPPLDAKTNDDNDNNYDDGDRDGHCARHEKKSDNKTQLRIQWNCT